MIITFCGHADYRASKEDEKAILSILGTHVGDDRADLYLGGYGGFDRFARRCGKTYQTVHPRTKLILVTPYLTPAYQKNHLNTEKKEYDAIIYPELEHVPTKFAILYRNRWMVEKADLVIAYVLHERGGAYQSYLHALKKQKPTINLADV
ncbi:MAG: DUF1273 domain-containing protein [Clostridia bacterium]|nr:DUF1273 domain-containing protein [Clostridia bacterium]